MKDKWINAGYEGEELKPHSEPVEDLNDTNRIGKTHFSISTSYHKHWSQNCWSPGGESRLWPDYSKQTY